jgi:mono/diheme cytochrome c family protein
MSAAKKMPSRKPWGSGMRWLLLASTIWLTAAAARAQPAADPANGLVLAQKLCSGCHLVAPRQRGPVPDGVPSFMALAQRPGLEARQVKAALLAPPHPLMPNPPLDVRQMDDVAAYVLSLRP